MTTLILVRHGESEANRIGVFAGHLDVCLQEKGKQQARLTAQYLAEHRQVDLIYSSDLMRAHQTAKCLADVLGVEILLDAELREIHAGAWEGMKFDDLISAYGQEYEVWLHHIGRCQCPGGESVPQLAERVMRALTRIAEENEGKTVVVATHATPIRAAQSMISCGSTEDMERIPWVSNASVTILTYQDRMWKTVMVGEDRHLAEMKTQFQKNV